MKVGVSSMFFGDMEITEFFNLLCGNPGVKLVDLWYDTPFYLLEDDSHRKEIVESIRKQLGEFGIEAVAHAAAFDVNPIAYSPAAQRLTLEETERSLVFASQAGARHVTLHGGFSSFGNRVSRFDLILLERFVNELIEYIKDQKLDITLCIENDAASATMSRPFEALHILNEVLDKHPALGCTIDLAHVLKTTAMEETCRVREQRLDCKNLPAFAKIYADRIKILHFSSPTKYRTHGRVDLTGSSIFFDALKSIKQNTKLDKIACIFEYELDDFDSPTSAIAAIGADAGVLSSKLYGE